MTSMHSKRRWPAACRRIALLSHDLFEGSYARDRALHRHPCSSTTTRRSIWRSRRGSTGGCAATGRSCAGCGGRCRTRSGRTVRNVLPVIARWKIFDNLRRSLLAPSLVVLLVAGWTVLPGGPLLWTVLALLVLAFPVLVQVARSLSTRVRGVPLREHIARERPAIVAHQRSRPCCGWRFSSTRAY